MVGGNTRRSGIYGSVVKLALSRVDATSLKLQLEHN